MASYDISRVAFDPRKHYTSVRMQQGRVALDEDLNEGERIENEERRRSRIDIIGPYGSPDMGFYIENVRNTDGFIDFDIHPGTLHVGGMRLEMEAVSTGTPPDFETFRLQKDWLQQVHDQHPVPVLPAGSERYDLVYLQAWTQAVSAVEDEELIEVALGGPDTSTRIRSMRRVLLAENIELSDCKKAWKKLIDDWKINNGGTLNEEHERIPDTRLTVSYTEEGISDDLCSPSIAGGYLGAENQAIRVQLTDSDHFTWGFDNASPLYRVLATAEDDTVTFLTEPRDQHHWPLAGQIVEILPWSAVLPNGEKIAEQRGHLSKIASSYDPDTNELTLATPLPADFGTEWTHRSDSDELRNQEPAEYFYLRVWNRGSDQTSEPEIPFTAGTPVALGHTGLEITISGDDRLADDFWVIGARPETPNQVMPWGLEEGLAPHGYRRFYAPLALIRWTGTGSSSEGEVISDCRKTFRPLTDLESCCTYHVGDGIKSKGDFNSIEEAVQNLPAEGGKICVLPGEHIANVSITGRKQIRISGCGERTIIRPHPDRIHEPIFYIDGSQKIRLDHMSLVAIDGTAIKLRDTGSTTSSSNDITIDHNRILAFVNAIHLHVNPETGGNNDFNISNNKIGMLDKEEGDVAIFTLADGVLIERNRIVVVPPPDPEDPNDPRDAEDPGGDLFDPCADPGEFYAEKYPLFLFLNVTFRYVNSIIVAPGRYMYKTKGGIQIGGSSEGVRISGNKIIGGHGNGITLGHLPVIDIDIDIESDPNLTHGYRDGTSTINHMYTEEYRRVVSERFFNILYDIVIEENHIELMGLSGIGVVSYFNLQVTGLIVSVEDLTVYRNRIMYCARQIPDDIPVEMLDQAGFGGVTLADCTDGIIQENRIENNGISQVDPICGIFIYNGERVDITNNRIVDNGPRVTLSNDQIRMGQRGGIVIRNTFKFFKNFSLDNLNPVMFDNTFAVKIHNNVVVQPLGHALLIYAFGPVSVVGNQMTSRGIHQQNPFNLLAGTVFILNIGFSKDLIAKKVLPNYRYLANNSNLKTNRSDVADTLFQLFQYLPGGQVMFANNQVTLDLRSPEMSIAISSQAIVSLDDVAYNNNQAECTGFISVRQQTLDIVLTDVFLAAYSVRSNDNRFQEGFTLALYSLISLGFMNTALGNQSSYCLLVYGSLSPPPAIFNSSNMVLDSTRCRNDYSQLGQAMVFPGNQYYQASD